MRVLFFVALLTAVDQLTKYWAVVHLKPIGSVAIVPGFSVLLTSKIGGRLGHAPAVIFLIGFSLLTLAFLCWRRRQLFDHLWGGRVTFTLLVGGILGNLIDRIRLNYVVDFLDFFWGHHHFPAFNVADSAICCGVFLFILTQWIHDRKHGHRH